MLSSRTGQAQALTPAAGGLHRHCEQRRHLESALQLITSERIDTAALITHRFPLSAVHEAT
jgi:threonine dehydrogenase-like Zn-dependent dehydrogenase